MTDEQDGAWVEALAGRERSSDDPVAVSEGQALRKQILARPVAPVDAAVNVDPAREDELIARARRERLLPRRIDWRAGLAVAALLCLAITAAYQFRQSAAPIVVRGAPSGIVLLQAIDPVALKQQLLRELRATGVNAGGYERLGRQGIDADLPEPVSEEIRALLQRYAIPVPSDGVLRVEIVAMTPR